MTKIYAKGTTPWEVTSDVNLSVDEIISRYNKGLAGTFLDTEEYDRFTDLSKATGGYTYAEDAAHAFGWADAFAGQLVIPFVHVMERLPGAWPGPAQVRGDCVSHSDKNAKLGTMIGDVISGVPDEETGFLEMIPEIGSIGLSQGGFATEVAYWFRGSNRDGWYCEAAANVSMTKAGGVIRKNYPEIGVDLSKYSGSNAGKWGASPPPQSVISVINKNLIRTAARVNTVESMRDLLGQGRFISSCGSEGFSSTRDANGVASRRGSWAHAMSYIAIDDREETKRKYGGPLVLVLNSWGPSWISGPRDIPDSAKYVPASKKDLWIRLDIVNPQTGNIMIPKGSFWARWSDVKQRSALSYAGFNGWKVQKIKDWGGSLWG